jgi:hypothetical protein
MNEGGKTVLEVAGALSHELVPLIAGVVWLLVRLTTNQVWMRTAGVVLALVLAASFAADGVLFEDWWWSSSQVPGLAVWLYLGLCVVIAQSVAHNTREMSVATSARVRPAVPMHHIVVWLTWWLNRAAERLARTGSWTREALRPLRSRHRTMVFVGVPIAELLALGLVSAWWSAMSANGPTTFLQLLSIPYVWGNFALLTLIYIAWCAWCLALFLAMREKTRPETSRAKLLVFVGTPVVFLADSIGYLYGPPMSDAVVASWALVTWTLALAFLVWCCWATAALVRLLVVDHERIRPSRLRWRVVYLSVPWVCLVALGLAMTVISTDVAGYLALLSALYLPWAFWCLAVVRPEVRGSAAVWLVAVLVAFVIDVTPARGDLYLLGTMAVLATIGCRWLAVGHPGRRTGDASVPVRIG